MKDHHASRSYSGNTRHSPEISGPCLSCQYPTYPDLSRFRFPLRTGDWSAILVRHRGEVPRLCPILGLDKDTVHKYNIGRDNIPTFPWTVLPRDARAYTTETASNQEPGVRRPISGPSVSSHSPDRRSPLLRPSKLAKQQLVDQLLSLGRLLPAAPVRHRVERSRAPKLENRDHDDQHMPSNPRLDRTPKTAPRRTRRTAPAKMIPENRIIPRALRLPQLLSTLTLGNRRQTAKPICASLPRPEGACCKNRNPAPPSTYGRAGQSRILQSALLLLHNSLRPRIIRGLSQFLWHDATKMGLSLFARPITTSNNHE